jgi:hypothetical protein
LKSRGRGTELAQRSFPELSGDLLDGSILGLGDDEPDVQDEEDLDDDEDDEDVGADRQLNRFIFIINLIPKDGSACSVQKVYTVMIHVKNKFCLTNLSSQLGMK